jgi:hypothetical protein
LIVGWVRRFVDQVLGSNYDAGRTEAALQSSGGDETVCKRVTLEFAEALKRQHSLAGYAFRGDRASDDCPAVDYYGATSALTLRAATVLGRDHAAAISQDLKKR